MCSFFLNGFICSILFEVLKALKRKAKFRFIWANALMKTARLQSFRQLVWKVHVEVSIVVL